MAKTFAQRLEEILSQLRDSTNEFETKAKELINLLKVMKGGGSHYPEGISNARSKALWNNRASWCSDLSDEQIADRIKAIDEFVEYDAGRDYKDRFSADGKMMLQDLRSDYPGLTEEQLMNLYMLIANN